PHFYPPASRPRRSSDLSLMRLPSSQASGASTIPLPHSGSSVEGHAVSATERSNASQGNAEREKDMGPPGRATGDSDWPAPCHKPAVVLKQSGDTVVAPLLPEPPGADFAGRQRCAGTKSTRPVDVSARSNVTP